MIRGYIRVAVYGPTEEEQRATLARAGLTDPPGAIYVDHPPKRRKQGASATPERDNLIRSLRPASGDVVLVMDESIIGADRDDRLGAMARIAERDAVVRVASTGKEYAFLPRDAAMMDFFRDGDHIQAKARAAHARKAATKMGKGGVLALQGTRKDKARQDWHDPKLSSAEVADRYGVSRTTLHNTFGPRGTPDATQKGRRR